MADVLVSVIVPNYCHAKYLDQRLQSILNQSYKNIEVIILDDCSPDGGASKSVIEKYRTDPRVSHIVYNEKNSGNTFVQWQRGLNLAKGKLCWLAESDDFCELNLLEKLVKAFEKHPDSVIAYSTVMEVDESGMPIASIRKFSEQHFSGEHFIKHYLVLGNYIMNASCALFSKEAALKIRDNYMGYSGAGDYLFWVEIAEQGSVSVINEQLSYFRRHNSTVTSKKDADGTNFLAEKEIFNYITSRHSLNFLRQRLAYIRHIVRVKKCEFNSDEIRTQIWETWRFKTNQTILDRIINKLFVFFSVKYNYFI